MALRRNLATLALCIATLVLFMGRAQGCTDVTGALTLVNQLRANHSASAVTWNATQALNIKTWTTYLASQGCSLKHSNRTMRDGPWGENVYNVVGTTSLTGRCARANQVWYNEVSKYKFTATPYTENKLTGTGHFTMMIWRASTQMACAAVPGTNCVSVVCRYASGGNIAGDTNYLNNVKPKKP